MPRPAKALGAAGRGGEGLLVLGIETSCDDTGAAVIELGGRGAVVLGEAKVSQAELHNPWGGVVPTLAADAHQQQIDAVVAAALLQAGISEDPSRLSAIAVTAGPGLSACLQVGVDAAEALSARYGVPVIPIHHMEAHALVVRMQAGDIPGEPHVKFPFLCCLLSGGHTLLLVAHGVGRYTQLGTTCDDALGEAYDKVARILGLHVGGGGGPILEKLARLGDPLAHAFTVPMRQQQNCNFSFAGLKTAVRLTVERELPGIKQVSGGEPVAAAGLDVYGSDEEAQKAADIAASFQHVATTHLKDRIRRAHAWAMEVEPSIEHLVLAGGVASNTYVRGEIEALCCTGQQEPLEKRGKKGPLGLLLACPPPALCVDNGAMVAWAGLERLRALEGGGRGDGQELEPPSASAPVEVYPRWPLSAAHHDRASGMNLHSVRKPKGTPPPGVDAVCVPRGGAK